MRPTLFKIGFVTASIMSLAVALFSYRYVARIGFVPPNIAANRFLDPWLVVHASTAATALLLGPLQLMSRIRRNWPKVHRGTGWAYTISCFVGGASGAVLSRGVSTGPIAAMGFGILAILWLYVTTRGLITARARQFTDHRRWMIRSFALTFAAVTLRLYIPISLALNLDFVAAYQAIAWLAWVPNALLAEAYLRRSAT